MTNNVENVHPSAHVSGPNQPSNHKNQHPKGEPSIMDITGTDTSTIATSFGRRMNAAQYTALFESTHDVASTPPTPNSQRVLLRSKKYCRSSAAAIPHPSTSGTAYKTSTTTTRSLSSNNRDNKGSSQSGFNPAEMMAWMADKSEKNTTPKSTDAIDAASVDGATGGSLSLLGISGVPGMYGSPSQSPQTSTMSVLGYPYYNVHSPALRMMQQPTQPLPALQQRAQAIQHAMNAISLFQGTNHGATAAVMHANMVRGQMCICLGLEPPATWPLSAFIITHTIFI